MNALFRQSPRNLGAQLVPLYQRFVDATRMSNAACTRFYLGSAAVFAVIGVFSWLWQFYNPPSPRPGSQPAEGRPASPESAWVAIRPVSTRP